MFSFFFCGFSTPLLFVRRDRSRNRLDELLERTVDGGADVGDALPEVNSGNGTIGNALGSELEFLHTILSGHVPKPDREGEGDVLGGLLTLYTSL